MEEKDGMSELISIETPITDQRSIQLILSILDNCPYAIPGLPRFISPKTMATRIHEGRILAIVVKNKELSKVIGALVADIDEANEFGSFTLLFDKEIAEEPVITASAVRKIRTHYQNKGLSKMSLLLPENDVVFLAGAIIKGGFSLEGVLADRVKDKDGFKDVFIFSAVNGRRKVKPLIPARAEAGQELEKETLAEKPKEKPESEKIISSETPKTPKLGINDKKVLKIIIKKPEGIWLKDIIGELRKQMPGAGPKTPEITASLSAQKFADIGLITKKKVNRETFVIPNMEEIRNRFSELMKEIKEPEKVPEVEVAQEKDEDAAQESALRKETTEEVKDSFTEEEKELLDSLSDKDKQVKKGIELLGLAMEDSQEIKFSDIGSKCGVKKEDAETFLQALIKTRNREIKRGAMGIIIEKITVNDPLDYERKTAKIEPRKEIT